MFRRVREAKRRWHNRTRLLPAVLGLAFAVWGLVPLIGALTGSGTDWRGLTAGIFLIVVGLGISLPALAKYRSARRSRS